MAVRDQDFIDVTILQVGSSIFRGPCVCYMESQYLYGHPCPGFELSASGDKYSKRCSHDLRSLANVLTHWLVRIYRGNLCFYRGSIIRHVLQCAIKRLCQSQLLVSRPAVAHNCWLYISRSAVSVDHFQCCTIPSMDILQLHEEQGLRSLWLTLSFWH